MSDQPPDPASAEALARAIADRLFTNCQGEQARRLVLVVDDPRHRHLGCWGFGPAVDQIRPLIEAHVATLTEQLTSANARFCDQHRGIYRTSGCVVCGLMAAAVELRESEAKAATLTEQRAEIGDALAEAGARGHGVEGLSEADAIRQIVKEYGESRAELQRALEQMDTETARANGLGEVNQQLGAKLRTLEAALGRAVETIRAWHGMGMPATVRYAEAAAWALYQESPEMKAITAALAAVRAPEPQEPQP